jgi:SAM-dependent methyltransferase
VCNGRASSNVSSSKQKAPSDFESQWRKRFEDYGRLFSSEAQIAGWTANGLATRLQVYESLAGHVQGHWLDVGCGAGSYVRSLLQRGASAVTGVDYSVPSLYKARELVPASQATWLAADARHLPFPQAAFAGVLCFGVTQALSEASTLVEELVRVTAPGGQVWVDGLNHQCFWHRAQAIRARLRGYGSRVRFENPDRICEVLRGAGCSVAHTHWVPIFPERFRALQDIAHRPLALGLPGVGRVLSHAFMIRSRKAA